MYAAHELVIDEHLPGVAPGLSLPFFSHASLSKAAVLVTLDVTAEGLDTSLSITHYIWRHFSRLLWLFGADNCTWSLIHGSQSGRGYLHRYLLAVSGLRTPEDENTQGNSWSGYKITPSPGGSYAAFGLSSAVSLPGLRFCEVI